MTTDKCPFCMAEQVFKSIYHTTFDCGTMLFCGKEDRTKHCLTTAEQKLIVKNKQLIDAAKFAVEEWENGYGAGHDNCECGMCNLKKVVE